MKAGFQPPWIEQAPPPRSLRSIFKWGAPEVFKHPSPRLYAMLKDRLGLSDADFTAPRATGEEPLGQVARSRLTALQLSQLTELVGADNVETDGYSRVRHSRGQTSEEAMMLRRGEIADVADAVVHPRDKTDVQAIVAWCHEARMPLSVFGGGSSVTLGLTMAAGGVVLALGTHMDRLLDFNESDQTVTVEPGMMGPEYEALLNDAPRRFGAQRRYTGGHFPQSFEFSSVGGWVAALGSGQASSYYGDAADLLLGLEVVTPAGTLRTHTYPAAATGPKVVDLFKGSEGSFGIIVGLTLKFFRLAAASGGHFAYVYPNWTAAVAASREISQGEFGMPAVYRISDAEETDTAMKLYGVEGTILDRLMRWRGFNPEQRCLCLGSVAGEDRFSRNVKQQIHRLAKAYGAMSITSYPAKQWEQDRFLHPYMREDLGDYGIVIDTLETSVKWSHLHEVHQEVRRHINTRPRTICMTHASHFYPQGTNLYFIFMGRFPELEEYREFHRGIIRAIVAAGGAPSHHHGIGRLMAPVMAQHLGPEQMAVLRSLKAHFDPRGILAPGVLGL